jgi:hypothetical protein
MSYTYTTRSSTDAALARTIEKVELGNMNWGAILQILNDRASYLRQNIRPLPGYAPEYDRRARMAAELEERLDQIREMKAIYSDRS